MSRVRCPRCSTVVEVAPGEKPVCPNCGFGREQGAAAAPAASTAAPATTAPVSSGAPGAAGSPDAGYGAPSAPAGGHDETGQPGTLRSPGLIVLFYIITLGIYGFVWHYKTGVEVDRFKPDTRASGMLKGYVWISVAATVVAIIAIIIVFGAIFAALGPSADAGRDPSEDEIVEAFVGAGAGFVLILLAVVAGLVAEVLKFIGMWRVWTMTAAQQTALGLAALSPGMLLIFLLSPHIANFVQIPFSFVPILGALVSVLLALASVGLTIACYVLTQVGLNQVWQAHGAR